MSEIKRKTKIPKDWPWALNSERQENVNCHFNHMAPRAVCVICCSISTISSGEDKKNQSSIMGKAHEKNGLPHPESNTMKGQGYGLGVQILPLPLTIHVTFAHDFTFLHLSIFAWKMSIMIIMREHMQRTQKCIYYTVINSNYGEEHSLNFLLWGQSSMHSFFSS